MNTQYKLETALNPFGWLIAYDLIHKGKAITIDQLPGFDVSQYKEIVQINKYGVVLFYDKEIACFIINKYWVRNDTTENKVSTKMVNSLGKQDYLVS